MKPRHLKAYIKIIKIVGLVKATIIIHRFIKQEKKQYEEYNRRINTTY